MYQEWQKASSNAKHYQQCPCRGGFVWAAFIDGGEEADDDDDGKEYSGGNSGDQCYRGAQAPSEDYEANGEEDNSKFEKCWNNRNDADGIPCFPCFAANLTNNNIFPMRSIGYIPGQVFANPLFGHDTAQRRGEAQHEAVEEQHVDPASGHRSTGGRRRRKKARDCRVDRRRHVGVVALGGDLVREELDRCIIVTLLQ